MYGIEDIATIVGTFCSLIVPYQGYTEGVVTEDFGTELIVTLSNGKELTVYRSDIILMD
jgi:hypothetical protein